MRRVTSQRGRLASEARCESCEMLRVDATRERVRQHCKVLGHVVHFVIRDITTYYPPERAL